MQHIVYILKNPVEIHKDGEVHHGTNVEITAPLAKLIRPVMVIDSAISSMGTKMAAQMADKFGSNFLEELVQKSKEQKEDVSEDSQNDDFVMSMTVAEINLAPVFDALKEILRHTAKIDGVGFTDVMFEKMTIKDAKGLLNIYIKSFLDISPESK